MTDETKRRGRPAGKRGTFSFRVTSDLRTKLQEVAAAAGRPVSEEIERRLELSFLHEDLVQAVRDELRNATLSTGPEDKELARKMDEMCGPAAYQRINGSA